MDRKSEKKNSDGTKLPCLNRLFRSWLLGWPSRYRWARKLHGGRWEEWWADSGVNAYIWMHNPQYLSDKPRPGGCAIWEDNPKPRRVEIYSANVEHHTMNLKTNKTKTAAESFVVRLRGGTQLRMPAGRGPDAHYDRLFAVLDECEVWECDLDQDAKDRGSWIPGAKAFEAGQVVDKETPEAEIEGQNLAAEHAKALAVINAIEERYIDGCDVHADWKFMGQTAREYLVPTKVSDDINYEKK